MINVSNSFKEELNNDNRDYMCYVDIVLVNPGDVVESYLQDSSGEYILDSSGENINTFFDGVAISLTNENLWSSALSIEESVSNQNSFDIGSVIINKATIVINNIYEDYTSYDFTGAKVTIRIGLQLSNGTIEVVNKGIFYVDSATYNGSLITLECLDSMSKFDKDYSESELIYPATLRQIVQDACSVCGVLYSASIFENDTFIVNERPSDESLTFRQMLNYVGQIACQQFSIDHNDRLIARWYDRDMMDDLYSSPSSVDDSEYHQISSINSQNINQDDVIITGVKVTEFSESTENPGGSYLSGTTGYVIEIKDNKLIPIGKGSGVSTYLGQKLVGMRFRPMELTFQNDPTIEPTDIAEVIDFKGNRFYTFITSTNFTVGNTQTLSCGAESSTRNSASRYSAATQAYTNSKKLVEKEKTERELAVEALNNALSNASGMYTTEERQSDGSVITYLHDKPTLEESQNVIMITAEAIGISNDGGETYPYGLFLTGDLIARLLYVVGINADYINSGAITVADNDGEITFFADTETGRVDIKAYSLTITGKTVEEIANEESETVLNDFVGSVYTPTITNLQNQIDGQIETWFYNYIPTAENYPASEWTTDTEKDKHLGDLFYVVDNTEYGGQAYRWAKIGTDYLWDYVEDTAVVKALADAAAAQDTADQKRRVFVVTPYPPYDVGDLWVGDDTSEMMRCQVSRQSGNYVSTDWIKAVKYTDDTELYNFIQNDYADTIQEIYNSVDQKSETWYQPEDPSLNWTDTESVSLADVSGDSIIDVSGEEIFTVFESEKFKHEGDLWKDSDTNIEYIYKGGTWVEMPIPDAVFDEIDGKAQIFVVQPTPPYNIGDTWFTGTTILVCNIKRNSGDFVSSDWTKKDNYTDDSALYEFIEGDYAETIEELKSQTDGKAETWYQATDPAASWNDDEKSEHTGDLWYNTADQKTYIYNGSSWDETKSTPPDEVFDEIDGKAQIFISTPVPPYAAGDLWFNSTTSDIMTCISSRNTGEFNASDWQKRNKYTDDSYAQEVNAALNDFISDYSEEISDIQNQIDKKAETWYQESDPSVEWTETMSDALCDLSGESIQDSTDSEIITIWESEKSMHDGDLWHVPSTGKEYIYVDGMWKEMDIPDDVFDLIDGKAQIFVAQPVPPYSVGDLWFNSDTSDIMTCINNRNNGSYNEGDWQKRNKYTDDTYAEQVENNLNNFSEAVTEDMDNLQTQIDGKIETWYYEHEPTLENEPASGWTTDAEKQKHIGDLFYRQSNGHSYRFMKTGEDEFEWTLIQDSDIQNALTTANNAQDTADNKRRVFVTTPVPPYDIGDLWVQGANGDIMRCVTSRASGDYDASDWEKASKYTDDTAVEELDESLNQQEVFDRLTNGGTAQGIYIKDGNIFVNASYIQSGTMSADRIYGGTLSLGGVDNSGGVFNLYDENGTLKSVMDNDGFNFCDGEKFVGSIRTRYMEEYERGCFAICANDVSVVAISSSYLFDNDPDSEIFNSDMYMTNTMIYVDGTYKLPGTHFPRDVYFEDDVFVGENGIISETEVFSSKVLKINVSPGDDIWIGANSNAYGDTEIRIYGDLTQMRDPSSQSDERLKTEITQFSKKAIDIINDIQIYGYTWIESGESEKAGFIAQQLEHDVDADLTRIGKDGVHNVKPTKIIPYLVKSVQELSKEIELLKKEICELKGETYIPKESKKDKWKPSDMSLEEKREFIKSLRRAEMKK